MGQPHTDPPPHLHHERHKQALTLELNYRLTPSPAPPSPTVVAEFIEGMQLRYHTAAAASGALMASAAGFDSVPADMGALCAARAFVPPAVPSDVEAVIQFDAPLGTKVHFATW